VTRHGEHTAGEAPGVNSRLFANNREFNRFHTSGWWEEYCRVLLSTCFSPISYCQTFTPPHTHSHHPPWRDASQSLVYHCPYRYPTHANAPPPNSKHFREEWALSTIATSTFQSRVLSNAYAHVCCR
jgi:hypothetical protein